MLLVLAGIELGSYLALRLVIIPRDPSLVYVAPEIDREEYQRYLALRHPVLGWVPRAQAGSTQMAESRPVPSFPNASPA